MKKIYILLVFFVVMMLNFPQTGFAGYEYIITSQGIPCTARPLDSDCFKPYVLPNKPVTKRIKPKTLDANVPHDKKSSVVKKEKVIHWD